MWRVAELDEEYIRRMEDILAVYEKPLRDREPVVCVDEKPVVLHQEIRPPLAMRPGRIALRDGEYQRGGTANVFCGVQPKAGRYFPKVTAHRSSPEFADLLEVAIRFRWGDLAGSAPRRRDASVGRRRLSGTNRGDPRVRATSAKLHAAALPVPRSDCG
jgi:hypothetical protein